MLHDIFLSVDVAASSGWTQLVGVTNARQSLVDDLDRTGFFSTPTMKHGTIGQFSVDKRGDYVYY